MWFIVSGHFLKSRISAMNILDLNRPRYLKISGRCNQTLISSMFNHRKATKTGSDPKIVDIPLIRRLMVDLLMKVLGTLPWKSLLPFLSLKTDKTGSALKYVNRLKYQVLGPIGDYQAWWVSCQYHTIYSRRSSVKTGYYRFSKIFEKQVVIWGSKKG